MNEISPETYYATYAPFTPSQEE